MDSSKIIEGTEECSSNESGWTMYIGSSPDREFDHYQEEDEEDCSSGEKVDKKTSKEEDAHHEDADSDDSMASDASSGPSNLYGHVGNKDLGEHVDKKQHHQKEDKKQYHEQMKAATHERMEHKANNNSGKRSSKK